VSLWCAGQTRERNIYIASGEKWQEAVEDEDVRSMGMGGGAGSGEDVELTMIEPNP
jgi:hypothetical protein